MLILVLHIYRKKCKTWDEQQQKRQNETKNNKKNNLLYIH